MKQSTIKRKKPISSNLETRPISFNLLLTLTSKNYLSSYPSHTTQIHVIKNTASEILSICDIIINL